MDPFFRKTITDVVGRKAKMAESCKGRLNEVLMNGMELIDKDGVGVIAVLRELKAGVLVFVSHQFAR